MQQKPPLVLNKLHIEAHRVDDAGPTTPVTHEHQRQLNFRTPEQKISVFNYGCLDINFGQSAH